MLMKVVVEYSPVSGRFSFDVSLRAVQKAVRDFKLDDRLQKMIKEHRDFIFRAALEKCRSEK